MVASQRRNLIMCVTPLQLLIAEKIIQSKPDELFDLVLIALQDNEKYRYYFQRVGKICQKKLFIPRGRREITSLFSLINGMQQKKIKTSYTGIYLASIDSRLLQYIISKNINADIFTFDDGVANIIPKGHYYSDGMQGSIKKLIWKILGVRYTSQEIRNQSKLHFTIYKDVPNIVKNTKYISLINNVSCPDHDTMTNNNLIIFLGQPLFEIDPIFTNEYVLKIIKEIKIDFYFPHPREVDIVKGNFEIIKTNYIFEDYISKFLDDNPNIHLTVISFISSALINVSSLSRVNVKYIYDENLFKIHSDFFKMASIDFGIECKYY